MCVKPIQKTLQCFWLWLAFLGLTSTESLAQIDKEFWFVAPEVSVGHGDSPIYFRLSTFSAAATVTIEMPANLSFAPITVSIPANSTQTVNMTTHLATLENFPTNTILNKGIHITSTARITAYYEVAAANNPAIYPLKGKNALGKLFFIPTQTTFNNVFGANSFEIVAIEDFTSITITPKRDLIGRAAAVPFTIVLNKGETFSCRALGLGGPDHLAGSKVESNKSIAITHSDDSITNGPGSGFDLTGDQLIPVPLVGSEYIAVRGFAITENIYIIGTQDLTDITIDGVLVSAINAGDVYTKPISGPVDYIVTSKPVYILHLSGNDGEAGDALLPPVGCTGATTISFVRSTPLAFNMVILTRDAYKDNFVVNGSAAIITAASFTPVPGSTDWVYARLTMTTAAIPVGTNRIENTEGRFHLGIINRLGGSAEYGFFSDYASLYLGEDMNACVGDVVSLDAGSGALSYLWNTGDTTQTINVNTTGNYHVKVDLGLCVLNDTIRVNFKANPAPKLGNDTLVCVGAGTIKLDPKMTPANAYTYLWSNSATTPTITVSTDGTYWVQVKDTLTRCIERDTIVVNFELPEIAQIRYGGIPRDTLEFCDGQGAQTISASHPSHVGKPIVYTWHNLGDLATVLGFGSTFSVNNFSSTKKYVVKVQNTTTGCAALDTVMVTFYSVVANITFGGLSVDTVKACNTAGPRALSAFRALNGPVTYEWRNLTTGGSVVGTGGSYSAADYSQTNTYEVRLQSTLAPCEDRDTVTVVFTPDLLGLPDTTSICTYGTVLDPLANAPALSWTGPDGFTASTPTVTVFKEGWYYVTAVGGSLPCKFRDSTYLKKNMPPVAEIKFDTTKLCAGVPVTLKGKHFTHTGKPITYLWSTGSTTDSTVLIASGPTNVTLRVRNLLTGCDSTVSVLVKINPNPVITIPDVVTICAPQDSVGRSLNTIYSYFWRSDSGGFGSDSIHRLVVIKKEGFYAVHAIQTSTGCTSSKRIFVRLNLPPVLGIKDSTLCHSQKPYLLVGKDLTHTPTMSYQWFNALAPTTVIASQSDLLVSAAGTYILRVYDSLSGCMKRDTARIRFNPDPNFNIRGYGGARCKGLDTLTLEASNLDSMHIVWSGRPLWRVLDGGRSAIIYTSGVVSVTVTDTSRATRCQTTKSLEVIIGDQPALPPLPSKVEVCALNTETLSAYDPRHHFTATYQWRHIESNSILSDSAQLVLGEKLLKTYGYEAFRVEIRITHPLSGCVAYDTVGVQFKRNSGVNAKASAYKICLGEEVELKAEGGWQYLWSTGDTSSSIRVKPTQEGIIRYVVTAQSLGDCAASRAELIIEVSAPPLLKKFEDIVSCQEQRILLDAFDFSHDKKTAYRWSRLDDGTILSEKPLLSIDFNNTAQGSYDVFRLLIRITDSLSGCVSQDTVLIQYERRSDLSIQPHASEICLGDSLLISSRGGTRWEWQDGQTTANIWFIAKKIGLQRFILKASYENGCDAVFDTTYIMVNPLPKIQAHSSPLVNICADDSLTLQPSGGVIYEWLHDPTLRGAITVSPKVSTTYFVLGTDANGCQNTDSVRVNVTPTIDLPPVLNICATDSVTIGAESPVPAQFFWTPGGDTTALIRVAESGLYSVRVRVQDCEYTRQTQVNIKPLPRLEWLKDSLYCFELGADERFERGRTHTLRAGLQNLDPEAEYIYNWRDSSDSLLATTDTLDIKEPGLYKLSVVAMYPSHTCSNQDSALIREACAPRWFVPTAFTPNSDELNERFKVFGKHIKGFQMRIYSRWGELIYELSTKNFDQTPDEAWWDGTFKGQPMPDGVYAYTISVDLDTDQKVEWQNFNGSFTLLR
ncbi:MAG: gliding motility-associated C-terminal domain-containing protein [Cytophagales bacterium]|nr:MAG: gliding motility-associated C-terminal domain-containing protein [Cytophagales bacterium]